ncbi:Uncharacterized RNA methyltransferase Cgl1903/cg2084 [Dermatophilus congolensis]|uniref:Uncharacterized RNA methyltransferase Cgl1903/cg2084 n=1 Tax=Dermatophilus congolensis TaxID=1863 RepID=A0A239VPN5_9MICO|nr:class I SAM-dependent RNA methyltransferase [Dermatophilus congolensis]SNV23604.1 Uncharacterized RNA methyltransferase Cgl1903/cg2084 [Dermatophilus congolensis]
MIGTRLQLHIERIAHGGHAVAHTDDGQVVFVRHCLPGEDVAAVVTKGKPGDRFVFADAVKILTTSAFRVQPRCEVSGPGGCGGCDFQHVDLDHQRELKAQVISEQLTRLGGIDRDVQVEPVPGDQDGLRWRTRMDFAVDRSRRAGLRRFRSRDVIRLKDCPIAAEEVTESGVFARRWGGARAVEVVVPNGSDTKVVPVPGGTKRAKTVTEHVAVPAGQRHNGFTGDFTVPTRGFWQVHPGAASTLVDAVLEGAAITAGDTCLDLYAGVGLFAAAMAAQVGPGGSVIAVESDPAAVVCAQRRFNDDSRVQVIKSRTEDALDKGLAGGRADVVVLDPPRSGAGAAVMRHLAALEPRVMVYVACDPAALARDLRSAGELGYTLTDLRAFDMFPMTHHVECVATVRRQGSI